MRFGYSYTIPTTVSSINLHAQDINGYYFTPKPPIVRPAASKTLVRDRRNVMRDFNINRRIDWRPARYMIRDVSCMFSNALLLYGCRPCDCWDVIRAGTGKSK